MHIFLEQIKPGYVFAIAITAFVMVHFAAGFIPVGGGAGWDGSVYLDYIQKIGAGQPVLNDPYRLSRTAAFLPLIFLSYIGMSHSQLLVAQAVVNSLILAGAAVLFFKTVIFLQTKKSKSVVVVLSMIFSWPFIVMPVYYPMLADHLALALSIVSIFAWSKNYKKFLAVIIAFSFWVTPGLFLVPLFLIALPVRKNDFELAFHSEKRYISLYYFSLLLLVPIIFYIVYSLFALTDQEIYQHPAGSDVGVADLKMWSVGFVAAALLAIANSWAKVLSQSRFWDLIDIKGFLLGIAAVSLSALAMFYFIDWSVGFRGPDLFQYLLLQSVAAPGKTLISHFSYFGPIFLIALIFSFEINSIFSKKHPQIFIFITFLSPLIILGSESRQWIWIFPFAVLAVALSTVSLKKLILMLLFAIALCLPIFVIGSDVTAAAAAGGEFGAAGWQIYFGRQGPWMSLRSYIIFIFLVVVFFGLYSITAEDATNDRG